MENRRKNFELVLTIGVAGSGKTTYVRREYPDYEWISMDRVRGILSLDPGDATQSPLAYRYCLAELNRVLAEGQSAVWDATSTTISSRKEVLTIAKKFGAKRTIVFFGTSLEEALKRNRNRKRIVPEFVIREQFDELEFPEETEADEIVVIK